MPEVSAPPPQIVSTAIPNVQVNMPHHKKKRVLENQIQAHEQPQPQPTAITNESVRRSQRERKSAIQIITIRLIEVNTIMGKLMIRSLLNR